MVQPLLSSISIILMCGLVSIITAASLSANHHPLQGATEKVESTNTKNGTKDEIVGLQRKVMFTKTDGVEQPLGLGFDDLSDVSRKFLEELILSVEKEVEDKWEEGDSDTELEQKLPSGHNKDTDELSKVNTESQFPASPNDRHKEPLNRNEADVAMELQKLALPGGQEKKNVKAVKKNTQQSFANRIHNVKPGARVHGTGDAKNLNYKP